MPALQKTPAKIAIVLLCVWHMFAVAVYSIPSSFPQKLGNWLQAHRMPKTIAEQIDKTRWQRVGPYLLWLSQWQQWNMFSPDPMRTQLSVEIQMWENGAWHSVYNPAPGDFAWWRYSREAKLLYNLAFEDRLAPVRTAYLASECRRLGLPEQVPVRLVIHSSVMKIPSDRPASEYWAQYHLEQQPNVKETTICPMAT